jgi:hypothetical protein
MSLKPLCATPDDLKSYTFKDFKGKLFKAIKKMAKVHDKPEAAAPFYLCADQKYADNPSAFFMVFGKLAKWKNYAKQNAPKIEALRGLCYVTFDEKLKSLVLNLMPVAGKLKAKENIIAKGLKTVVSASRCQVAIVKGDFSEEMMEKLEAATENMEEVVETAEDAAADVMEEQMSEMHSIIDNAKKSGLTPAQSKKLDEMTKDVENIENLLERLAAADDPNDIKTIDKEIRVAFSKYVGGK